ncbi:MAG TPA: dienelactone hydrolase family protein [Vicinamibacteria bacterium]
MKLRLLAFNALVVSGILGLGLAGVARAAEETVSYRSGEETISAFVVTPGGPGPHPAVIVIQEWWGLNDWVKDQARALGKEGYLALAVDLYRGKVASVQEDAHQLMMGAPPDRIQRDLKAAFAFLEARKDVKAAKIGAIGWCMGGRWTLALATEEPKLAAGVAYYGAPPTEAAAIARIKAPILGNFGGADKGPAPEQVKAFEAAMKAAGKTVDLKIYEGAGHAFANVNNPWGGYREEAAKDAWTRSLAWLAKYLKG